MLNRWTYYFVFISGILTMALGQFMARPQYYGTEVGRAGVHVFWFGFILFFGTLLTLLTRHIANHKNPTVVDAVKYELIIIAGTTGFIGFLAVTLAIYEKLVPSYVLNYVTVTGWDGDGRRGMLVLWFLLIIMSTSINLLAVQKNRHIKRSKWS